MGRECRYVVVLLVVSEMVSKVLMCDWFGGWEGWTLILAVEFVCGVDDVGCCAQRPECELKMCYVAE